MSNNNQIPVNMNNIPIQSNTINNPINNLNQMNLVLLNNNLGNLNLQNIQINQNFIFSKLIESIDNLDIFTFQNILSENQFNTQTKNYLLNKTILLYLSHFNQAKAQFALRQMITILLKLKANPNIRLRYVNNQNNNNNYAIFSIVEKNDIELVKIFLDNNVDINALDNQGRNCLFYLMTTPNNNNNLIDRKPLCTLLLKRGIKINYLDNNGISPLMESINKGYPTIMNELIKYGGNVNLININDGNTALHYAIKNQNHEVLYTLLSKGNCDLSIKNKNNETPIDLAEKMNSESNKDIYELIMKYANTGKEKNDDEYNKTNNNNNNTNNKNKKDKKSKNEYNNDNDKMFAFPKGDISSRVEIPFSFQNNNSLINFNDNDSSSTNNTGNNNMNNFNQFYSFIKIQNTPTLYLDISDETNQDKLIYDSLKNENENLHMTLAKKENNLQKFKNENDKLKNELLSLKNELDNKNNQIKLLSQQIKHEENKIFQQRQKNQSQIEQKDMDIQSLLIKFENLENDIKNENKIESENKIIDEKNINKEKEESLKEDENKDINNININTKKLKYLEKKFNNEKYTDSEVVNLLTTDLYDLYHYNKIIYDCRIQEIYKMINYLKEIIEIDVDIRLYGSYATQTSLTWSEVDLLIIINKYPNFINENYYMTFIQNLYHKLKSLFCGNVLYLNTHIITPIIKVETNENNTNLIYNIYTFDNTNYGDDLKNLNDNSLLNSIIMTKEYNNKYKGKFIPLLLGLKQLLYNANLINNYYNINSELNINMPSYTGGISSYALNIMLMSFLDKYHCSINNIQIGQIFIDFLKIYGFLMPENNNRRIIYLDYNNNGHNEKNEEIKFYENNNIDSLIIIDPFNIRNNLCEKMFGYNQIKTALMIGFCGIKDNCECSCHYDDTINYQGKTHCILNKIFKTVKRFTNKRKNQ